MSIFRKMEHRDGWGAGICCSIRTSFTAWNEHFCDEDVVAKVAGSRPNQEIFLCQTHLDQMRDEMQNAHEEQAETDDEVNDDIREDKMENIPRDPLNTTNEVRKTLLVIGGEDICISTVQLFNFRTNREHLPVYETMVFGGEHDQQWVEQCYDYTEAEAMHMRMVDKVVQDAYAKGEEVITTITGYEADEPDEICAVMNWNYRFVRGTVAEDPEWITLKEVYYDDGKPRGYSDPCVGSEDINGIIKFAQRIHEASMRPILDANKIGGAK